MSLPHAVFNFLFNLLILLGLVVLGWGPDDLGGLAAHPARLALCALFILYALARSVQSILLGMESLRDSGHAGWYRLQLLLMEAVLVLAPFFDRRGWLALPEGLRWAGLILAPAGMLIGVWAQNAWLRGKTHHPRALVTGGPYRWVRHPRLLNALLLGLGAALVFASGVGLALAGLLFAVELRLIRAEERSLAEQYGEEYAAYCARTRRLIPGVF